VRLALGRVVEVKGAKRLAVLPAVAGSFAVPLRLEDPEGEMVVVDHRELEAVVELLAATEDEVNEELNELPERRRKSVREGLDYVFHTPSVALIIAVLGIISLFGINFNLK